MDIIIERVSFCNQFCEEVGGREVDGQLTYFTGQIGQSVM
jgi:hypothetical protein